MRTWVLGCAAKVLQIVRIVRDEAMTRQALVQIRARVMHIVRAVGAPNVCILFLLNEVRLMRRCMHCHVQARMCLRMRSRVHLNVACVRPAYMSVQAIARIMGLRKMWNQNMSPFWGHDLGALRAPLQIVARTRSVRRAGCLSAQVDLRCRAEWLHIDWGMVLFARAVGVTNASILCNTVGKTILFQSLSCA